MDSIHTISEPLPGRNRQWRLLRSVAADEQLGPQHFEFSDSSIPIPGSGEILLRSICLGTSPAQRGYVSTGPGMHEKVHPGDVMRGRGMGLVVASNSTGYQAGELVIASTGWQDFSVHSESASGIYSPEKLINPVRPCSLSLGILGSAGLTAYFGLIDVGQVQAGQTVLVSAAAGGIGSCAVQIAKALGCRVIGIAGGPDKCRWLRDTLGVETTIDYRNEDVGPALDRVCPEGIDVFFDNVGGDQLQQALQRLAIGARVVVCGFISTDYADTGTGPTNYIYLLRRRARMEGFFIFDYRDRFAPAREQLAAWYQSGLIVGTDDVVHGLEHMPAALLSLFAGSNRGVRICQVAPDP